MTTISTELQIAMSFNLYFDTNLLMTFYTYSRLPRRLFCYRGLPFNVHDLTFLIVTITHPFRCLTPSLWYCLRFIRCCLQFSISSWRTLFSSFFRKLFSWSAFRARRKREAVNHISKDWKWGLVCLWEASLRRSAKKTWRTSLMVSVESKTSV